MSESPAPVPGTTQFLLAQIRDEIAGLRADVVAGRGGAPPASPDAQGRVVVTEPEPRPHRKS